MLRIPSLFASLAVAALAQFDRGLSFQNWDAALFKNFRVTEAIATQFRVELFIF